ncbi:hypothetical protein [Treponema primitia]|uniref:hypothetical protein n=1 Tax=Treponema primitia TaxID=88058 RepID=UPI003980CB19
MAEPIGDESIYYRLQGLKEGTIQYTDTSNALRLVREHGKDIRYNAAWKKWVVWTGDHWQIDDGYLIHDKGIEVIHSIYDEMLKTTGTGWILRNMPCRVNHCGGESRLLNRPL